MCKIKHSIHDLCTYLYLAYWWSVLRGQFFSNFSAIFLRYQANTCSISTVWLSYNNPLIASYIHWRHSDVVVSHFQLCILPMSLSLWTAFPCITSFLSPLSFLCCCYCCYSRHSGRDSSLFLVIICIDIAKLCSVDIL